MRQLPIGSVKPGMVLGRTVMNPRGDVLLNTGTILNEHYIETLRARGFLSVLVVDPDTDDVTLSDMLSERVRATVTSEVCQLFEGMTGIDEKKIADTLGRLRESVVDMVDEVLSGNSLVVLQVMRARDTYFFEHAIDGTIVALLIARLLGYDRPMLQRLAGGCLTRDIGMTRIPMETLNKTGPLGPADWEVVRQHPLAGYAILHRMRPSAVMPNAVALQHHERQDGFGYPRTLRGTNRVTNEPVGAGRIILDAEIAAVADVYDALGADRPHRPALAPDRIVVELQRLAGSQLNRAIVGQFLGILPVFPVGSEVVLRTGPNRGHRGIVVAVDPAQLARPIVRVLSDRDGRRVEPFEVDLRQERSVLASVAMNDLNYTRAGV